MPRLPRFTSLPTLASSSLARSALPRPSLLPSLPLFQSTPRSLFHPIALARSPLLSTRSTILSTLPLPAHRPAQIRFVTYGMEYQPSQRKRKRKHGFLARARGGKLGRRTLRNRREKGRRFLSH
ncbi:large subunit ribosomal protein L34, partial [Tremellales sp. Uapishka_1]